MASTVSAIGGNSVTPSDTERFRVCRGIIFGTSGTCQVEFFDGSVVTLPAMAAGVVHPLQIVRVFNTNTTASGIVVVY